MGNHKFRLSDMMPNAWFYKLKYMGKTRNSYTNPSMKKKQPPFPPAESHLPSNVFQPQSRKSYYYTRGDPVKPKSPDNQFPPVSPRKSTRKHRRPLPRSKISPKLVSSSVSSGCSCRASTLESDKIIISPVSSSPELFSDSPPPPDELLEFRADRFMPTESFDDLVSWSSSSSSYKAINSEVKKLETFESFDSITKPELARIITKPREAVNNNNQTRKKDESMQGSLSIKSIKDENDIKYSPALTKEQRVHSPGRKFQLNASQGVRLRVNSPRIGTKKAQASGRKSLSSSSSSSSSRTSSRRSSLSESLAVVKSSFDPHKDFKESMVEMIVQNDMKSSKDLEDLLVCYLSLNADEYHDLIIKVFKQIWFDFSNIRRK